MLRHFGHVFEVQPLLRTSLGPKRPDYAFFADQQSLDEARQRINTNAFFSTAITVGDAKVWTRNLDEKLVGSGDPFSNNNPSHQIDYYIRTSGLTWGILTSGKKHLSDFYLGSSQFDFDQLVRPQVYFCFCCQKYES